MIRTIRKHRSSKSLANVLARKEKIIDKEKLEQKEDELVLSINDKLVWSYKVDKNFKIVEITTVSYVATINNQNYTIIYYDNVHDGVMHSHLRESIQDSSDSPLSLISPY